MRMFNIPAALVAGGEEIKLQTPRYAGFVQACSLGQLMVTWTYPEIGRNIGSRVGSLLL